MKLSKLTISIAVVSILASAYSNASDTKSKKLHEQAKSYNVASDTISDPKKIEKAKKAMVIRDGFRDQTVMSNLEKDAQDAKLKLIISKMKLAKEGFILDNVPPEIMLSGDDAITQYIENNYISRNSGKKEESEVEVIWGSTSSALSIPNYAEWEPQIKMVEAPKTNVIKAPEPTIKKAEIVPVSVSERDAMAELGLSQEEIDSLLGENKADKTKNAIEKKSEKKTDTKEISSNVIIDSIEISRAVIMGKLTRANVKLEMLVIRGSQKKKVVKSFEKIKPGFLFEIDGSRFEFVSLDEKLAVFENLETQKTYRTLLN